MLTNTLLIFLDSFNFGLGLSNQGFMRCSKSRLLCTRRFPGTTCRRISRGGFDSLPKFFLIGQATGLGEAYAPPTKASKSSLSRDLTDTLFSDIRYSLTSKFSRAANRRRLE